MTISKGSSFPAENRQQFRYLLNEVVCSTQFARWFRTVIPVYGSCAGMIMLSDRVLDGREDRPSFGGIDIAVRRNAFGRQVDSFEADVVMPVIPGDPFPAVFIRAPWVEETTDSVEVLARVADPGSPGRIVAVRQGRLLATSFHPELTPDRRVHQYFLQIVKGDA
ncbi:MAG: pyridoxal 5'-phosphate synthase glutaminase subunit PdxT [Candidatus Nanopelagicales bacterium]